MQRKERRLFSFLLLIDPDFPFDKAAPGEARYCKGGQQNGADVFYGLADTHDFDVS